VDGTRVRIGVRVEGIVQGVGFRPFVHGLAHRLGVAGWVGNDAQGVFIEVEGDGSAVTDFLDALVAEAPPLAHVEQVSTHDLPVTGEAGFRIAASADGGPRRALISPDVATCTACLAEILDPADRRYRYAFTNCTNCGPRFTIIRAVPYDRPNTTMAGYAMCAACEAEYHDPADRRFHAQPTCCPACGPRLRFTGGGDDPIAAAAAWLREGRVVAVKGLGGFHLAALAGDEAAVDALRSRKHREDKPFAVLAPDLDWARRLVEVDAAARALLESPVAPIVLLPRLTNAPVAGGVAPGNRHLGVLLPYTPLHHLLVRQVEEPMVLTSGNVADEPIAYEDDEARSRLAAIADAFLTHDRPIHMRTDDSVTRVFAGRPLPVRRSRGHAPHPVEVAWEFVRPVLACGAELKHTFALASGRHVFVSHHIGDLENYETFRSFVDGVAHFQRLFDVEPTVLAHDLHPEYLSTKYAVDREGVELVGVQHHHAHIASCLADNGEAGPVIGVAFDGLGFGTDGTIWGGELLVADLAGFERVGWFTPVPMPGGTAAIREPWRMAAAYLDVGFAGAPPVGLEVAARHADRWHDVVALARSGVRSPPTSSAGRLFDAVAALLGVRDTINYEGQAAVELEQRADPSVTEGYPVDIAERSPYVLPGPALVAAVVDDLGQGVEPSIVAGRFHRSLASLVGAACARIRDDSGLADVALSGGVFQNQLLLVWTVEELERRGFRVLVHSRVPPNDGGISLGQAVVAGALGRR
jgi:hydrogenase maturation protein HypF